METIRRVIHISSQGQIAIPHVIRKYFGYENCDLEIIANKREIIVRRIETGGRENA